ncbi:hypothetical protein [Herbaspirillum sp. YR522]|uniref:hypothetical protein n=1 Tax=Herbaspirillum sp. YR522 TaxID=1144342 RepID=UPI00058D1E1F|nr:hypothetical protein [Herbaspirillum sp. YR522]
MEYLTAARDRAMANGDKESLALLREISRLHWVLLTTNQVLSLVGSAYGDRSVAKLNELRAILDREPPILKRKAYWVEARRQETIGVPKIRRPQDFDR